MPFITLSVGFRVFSEILNHLYVETNEEVISCGAVYYTVTGGFNRPFLSCFEPHYENEA